ncbi:expressed unknown protein [Seminavis robusta]|uniref:Uncharacterized protein n=2 Tax=Seminavis robusta TaxID=568900 RepID=A0A9N8E3V2_9STRA|nr:expressed unknown protein [Seminavis robusta]|eukprot:Sro591_g172100.1 n/a (286) ;mRNA; r:51266-52614
MANEDIPVAQAVPAADSQLVQVIAPATLDAGYSFMAKVDGKTVSITVPEGGVKEGQTFTAPVTMRANPSAPPGEATPLTGAVTTTGGTTTMTSGDPRAPRGVWKDNIFDCCILGPCHASLWCAMCFPQFLMGQVLTRMNMSWLAGRDSPTAKQTTFRNVVRVVVIYWIVATIVAPEVDADGEIISANTDPTKLALYQLVNAAFSLYCLIVLIKLRIAVRERYSIPTSFCPSPVEDVCCVCFCGCCTVAQLARQTANYHQHDAKCCSKNGLAFDDDTDQVATVLIV